LLADIHNKLHNVSKPDGMQSGYDASLPPVHLELTLLQNDDYTT